MLDFPDTRKQLVSKKTNLDFLDTRKQLVSGKIMLHLMDTNFCCVLLQKYKILIKIIKF